MKTKNTMIVFSGLLLGVVLVLFMASRWASPRTLENALHKIPQNALYYSEDTQPFTITNRDQRAQDYLAHYFRPWAEHLDTVSLETLKKNTFKFFKKFQEKPKWGANHHQLTLKWINELLQNVQWSTFPNLDRRAMMINSANMRALPTMLPAYKHWHKIGQGYPFDRLQTSHIAANTPIRLVHITRDGQWGFVITPNACGWIRLHNIAFVEASFIQRWRDGGRFIVTMRESVIAENSKEPIKLKARLGVLYPLIKTTAQTYQILQATTNENREAILKTAEISKREATLFPILLTRKNIASLINTLLGTPYDWGGMYGDHDCSSIMIDLFSGFGLFLPRNSMDQTTRGTQVILIGLSRAEKKKMIVETAIPFLTLLYMPGHIVLYIGQKYHEPYVFQDIWGFRTRNIFLQEGRAVIGKAVITPLDFGKDFINIPQTLLDKVESMVLLREKTKDLSVSRT